MDKRPIAAVCIFFSAGILMAALTQGILKLDQIFITTYIFILSAAASIKSPRISKIFLFLSLTSLGALLYLNSNIFPQDHISRFLGKDKLKAEIIGIIKSPAEARGVYYGKVRSRYLFEIEAIKGQGTGGKGQGKKIETAWQKVSGLTLIRIQTEKDYQYGDRLMVKGTIKKPSESVITTPSEARGKQSKKNGIASSPSAPRNDMPGKEIASSSAKKRGGLLTMTNRNNFNYKEYLENQNIFAIINASEKNVTLLSRDYKSNPVLHYAYLAREKLKDMFLEKMPLESGAFLRAILLGDRSELPKKLNESFRNSGTMHILPAQNTKKPYYSS